MFKHYNKLVRDLTVREIELDGRQAKYTFLDDISFLVALANKIVEEAEEVREAMLYKSKEELEEELVDIIEVTTTIMELLTDAKTLEGVLHRKRIKRGRFKDKLFLIKAELPKGESYEK